MIIRKILTFCCAFMLLLASSCSVVAAASGSAEPDLTRVEVGASRIVVEAELGEAVETKDGAEVYVYKLGDEPAPGRAILYLVADIFTLALFEYIAWPLEISNSGNAYELAIRYDGNDKVASVKKPKHDEPEAE